MKTKVTLREMVGTKIIYGVILVFYYWMWARRDWHDYYETIQLMVSLFTVIFFTLQALRIYKYNKEEKDELAIQNLLRADSIALKVLVAAAVVIAFACSVEAINTSAAGYALVVAIFVLTIIRFVIFCVMDSKGV